MVNKIGDSYLSWPDVATRLERHSRLAAGTALHMGKDFAVAPSCLHEDYPLGYLPSFVGSRFCSHLSDRSGRALPATVLRLAADVFGLSSRALRREQLSGTSITVLPLFDTKSQPCID